MLEEGEDWGRIEERRWADKDKGGEKEGGAGKGLWVPPSGSTLNRTSKSEAKGREEGPGTASCFQTFPLGVFFSLLSLDALCLLVFCPF